LEEILNKKGERKVSKDPKEKSAWIRGLIQRAVDKVNSERLDDDLDPPAVMPPEEEDPEDRVLH
jgi:hypothetical protein